jgi:hypothetical protein
MWLEDKFSQLEKIKCFTDIDGKITVTKNGNFFNCPLLL